MAAYVSPQAPSASSGPGRDGGIRVVHTPYSLTIRILLTLLFAATTAGFTALVLYSMRDVTLEADHATAQLAIVRTYPVLGPRRETLALGAIQGTGLRSRLARNRGLVYGVTLITAAGEEDVSFNYEPTGREAQKQALDAFLADPGAPPLGLPHDRGGPWALLLFLVPLSWAWLLWTMWQQATVRFEPWRSAIVLERRQWPLRLWTRAFHAGEVTGARADARTSRGRYSYRVVLTLASGEEVPLLTVWGNGGAIHQDVANRINEALGKA